MVSEKPLNALREDDARRLSEAETLSGAPSSSGASLDEAPTIGRYHMRRKVGEGGMGEVWEAFQQEPVRRRVAIKVIKAGMDTKRVVARFEAERQALAILSHPAVARVFDAGMTPQGRPFFAMEFVSGEPITTFCDRQRLSTRERLDLIIQVCEGVQHAHHRGVIHRDLKPSNILVTEEAGGRPTPKIIDFGLAKATLEPLTDRTLVTELGQLIGTPEYMSPEQAEITNLDIDTRTDVYSLGVVLYELLSGVLPFDSQSLRRGGMSEMQRRIQKDEAPTPSTRLSSLGADGGAIALRRRTESSVLIKHLRGDLDWIIMKALEKDRSRRYDSPADLAKDLRRHLANEPVLAAAPSTVYRVAKFVKRHKAGVAATSLVVLALVAGIAGTTAGMLRARAERDRARQAGEEMEQVVGFLVSLFKASDPGESLGETVTARQILDRGAARIGDELQGQPLTRARMFETLGKVYESLGLYDDSEKNLREALAIQRRELGPKAREVARSVSNMASLAYARADFAAAESLAREALAIHRGLQGDTRAEVASALTYLGVVLRQRGELEAAEQHTREALGMARGLPDVDARTLNYHVANLANILEDRGKSKEAGEHYQEALDLCRKAFGPVHLQVAFALDNLAMHFTAAGDLDRAEPLYRESLAMLRKVYGEEHPEVAQTMGNLADFLIYDKGASPRGAKADFAEAETLHRKALEMNQRIRPGHPFVGDNLSSLAELRLLAGQYTEAEKLNREALRVYRIKLPADHANILNAKEQLERIQKARARS